MYPKSITQHEQGCARRTVLKARSVIARFPGVRPEPHLKKLVLELARILRHELLQRPPDVRGCPCLHAVYRAKQPNHLLRVLIGVLRPEVLQRCIKPVLPRMLQDW